MARPAFKSAQDSTPRQGNRELPLLLDFSNTTTVLDNLFQEQATGQIETVQSIFIDNGTNAAEFDITFNNVQTIRAQPFTQGVYPVTAGGALSFKAVTSQGVKVPVILSNTIKNYSTWGPTPGVTVVPPLVNAGYDVEPLIAGDNVLVAGVVGEQVKLYRGVFSFGGASIIKFTDGPGGALLGAFFITAGGSFAFEPSGIPWFVTTAGNALILNSSAAVNAYGTFGYVQQ